MTLEEFKERYKHLSQIIDLELVYEYGTENNIDLDEYMNEFFNWVVTRLRRWHHKRKLE